MFTGPYYRYRTYWDSLHRPFSSYADPWPLTYYKLKQTAAFIILFLTINHLFSSEVMFILYHKKQNICITSCEKILEIFYFLRIFCILNYNIKISFKKLLKLHQILLVFRNYNRMTNLEILIHTLPSECLGLKIYFQSRYCLR